jgi:hypothetical protein
MSVTWTYSTVHDVFTLARQHLRPDQQDEPHSQLVEVQRFLSGYEPLDERTVAAIEAIASELFAAARGKKWRVENL